MQSLELGPGYYQETGLSLNGILSTCNALTSVVIGRAGRDGHV